MKPINFKETNLLLAGASNTEKDETSIQSLPVFSDGEQIISKWELSWKEKIQALFYGSVWLHVLSPGTQHPVNIQTYKTPFTREPKMKNKKGFTLVELMIFIVIFVGMIGLGGTGWVMNLYKFANCDFEKPFKEEILRGVGVIPPVGAVLGYMDLSDKPATASNK